MCLHLKLLDIDHPLTFEVCKLRQIEAHALIYLSGSGICSPGMNEKRQEKNVKLAFSMRVKLGFTDFFSPEKRCFGPGSVSF